MNLDKGMSLKKYELGFVVYGKHQIETMHWIYDKRYSTKLDLRFLAYDANFFPTVLPFGKWYDEEFKQKQIDYALNHLADWSGEIWLDDVRIKEAGL